MRSLSVLIGSNYAVKIFRPISCLMFVDCSAYDLFFTDLDPPSVFRVISNQWTLQTIVDRWTDVINLDLLSSAICYLPSSLFFMAGSMGHILSSLDPETEDRSSCCAIVIAVSESALIDRNIFCLVSRTALDLGRCHTSQQHRPVCELDANTHRMTHFVLRRPLPDLPDS